MPVDVMVVEDDEDVRSIVEHLLSSEGLAVVSFANGMAALSYLLREADPPRLILLDVDMPVMNGPQFLVALKNRRALSNIPVVVMTAAFQPTANVSVVRLLPKPFDTNELASLVKALLGRVDES